MSATGDRIDLSSLDTTATAMTEDGPVEVDVFARPSRGVLVGSTHRGRARPDQRQLRRRRTGNGGGRRS